MSRDSSTTFPSLPLELQELVLAQALKQLDTKHQFGVVPTVNQQWHGIALSTCRSLQLSIPAQDAAKEEQLEAWLATNTDVLLDLDLKFDQETYLPKSHSLGDSFSLTMGQMAQLRTLKLSGCHFHPELSRLRELTLLHFDGCMVSPEDLCSLSQLTALQSLRVCHLRSQPYFYFQRPDVTMRDMMNSICENHQQLTSLEVLVTANGCVCLDPFPSLYQLKELQQLSLPSMLVMPQDLQQAKQLPWVAATLRVQGGRQLLEVDLPAWIQQQQHAGLLEHLSLRYPSHIEPAQLPAAAASRALSSLPSIMHLQSVRIYRFDLTQSSHDIAALTALTFLELAGAVLDGEVLEAVATLTSLSTLKLKDNEMVTAGHESFSILTAGLCNVSSLYLRGDILSAPNLAAMASSLKQLGLLELGSLVRLEDAACLSSLVNLSSLTFQRLQLGPGECAGAAVTALTKLSKLVSLVIVEQERQFAVEDVLALTEAMQLTTIRIWYYGPTCGRAFSMQVIWGRLVNEVHCKGLKDHTT